MQGMRDEAFGKALWGHEGQGPALSSGTWRKGLDNAERGAPAPVFTRSGAGPVRTPVRPLVTSPPASRYRCAGRQARRARGWESGIRSSGSGLAHSSSVAVSSASLGRDPLPEGGSLELVDPQGSPSPDISQALDTDFLPPRGQSSAEPRRRQVAPCPTWLDG